MFRIYNSVRKKIETATHGSRLSQDTQMVINHDTKFNILEDKIRSWHWVVAEERTANTAEVAPVSPFFSQRGEERVVFRPAGRKSSCDLYKRPWSSSNKVN